MSRSPRDGAAHQAPLVSDVPFEEAADVGSIVYRLHPIDVGFSLRAEQIPVQIGPEDPLRVSYADDRGDRRVISGPRALVLRRLRAVGYRCEARDAMEDR